MTFTNISTNYPSMSFFSLPDSLPHWCSSNNKDLNENRPPVLPSRHLTHTAADDDKNINAFCFFYLVAGGAVLWLWMTGDDREQREVVRKDEWEWWWGERGNRLSALHALAWQCIMCMNEKEGTLLLVYLHLFHTYSRLSTFCVKMK